MKDQWYMFRQALYYHSEFYWYKEDFERIEMEFCRFTLAENPKRDWYSFHLGKEDFSNMKKYILNNFILKKTEKRWFHQTFSNKVNPKMKIRKLSLLF